MDPQTRIVRKIQLPLSITHYYIREPRGKTGRKWNTEGEVCQHIIMQIKAFLKVNNITGQNVTNIWLVLRAEIMQAPALSLVRNTCL